MSRGKLMEQAELRAPELPLPQDPESAPIQGPIEARRPRQAEPWSKAVASLIRQTLLLILRNWLNRGARGTHLLCHGYLINWDAF